MTEYGSIYIEQISNEGVGGGQYFNNIKRDVAEGILKKIYSMANDFILANDCSAELVKFTHSAKDKSIGFYIINRQENGLVKIFYQPEYESEADETDFSQVFDKILSGFFKIKNSACLLKKVNSKEQKTDEDLFELTVRGFLY